MQGKFEYSVDNIIVFGMYGTNPFYHSVLSHDLFSCRRSNYISLSSRVIRVIQRESKILVVIKNDIHIRNRSRTTTDNLSDPHWASNSLTYRFMNPSFHMDLLSNTQVSKRYDAKFLSKPTIPDSFYTFDIDNFEIELKTPLYLFQKRSVCWMMSREGVIEINGKIQAIYKEDIDFLEKHDSNIRKWPMLGIWADLNSDVEIISACRGGILAEEVALILLYSNVRWDWVKRLNY